MRHELDEGELASLRRRWSTAEGRVYPLAMVNVAAYQQAIEAIAALVAFLREETGDHAALVACAADPTAALDRLDADALGLVHVSVEDLVDAACASRDRELLQLQDQQRRREAAAAAADAGLAWMDIASAAVRGLLAGVPELRVHLPSRLGVRTWLQPDVDTGEPLLRLTPVALDPDTGALAALDEPDDLDLTAQDRAGWDAVLARLATLWGLEVDAQTSPIVDVDAHDPTLDGGSHDR